MLVGEKWKEDVMSKFIKIIPEVLVADESFEKYLERAIIEPAKKGGTFIGNRHDIALDEFRKYGIVLPKGGMIIPSVEPNELYSLMKRAREIKHQRYLKKRAAIRKAAEEKAAEGRARLLPQVRAMLALLENNAGAAEWIEPLYYGESVSIHGATIETSFRLRWINRVVGLREEGHVFDWTDDDIDRLNAIVTKWVQEKKKRLTYLQVLCKNGGVVKTETRKSFVSSEKVSLERIASGKTPKGAGDDLYDQIEYDVHFLGEEEINFLEKEWLKKNS